MPHNPEYDRAYQREWRSRNPEKSRGYHKVYRDRARYRALVAYGGDPPACACCGESRTIFLCLDHVGGGGNEHRRQNPNASGAYLATSLSRLGWPPGYRVLCWNCNFAVQFGQCPHQKESQMLDARDSRDDGPVYVRTFGVPPGDPWHIASTDDEVHCGAPVDVVEVVVGLPAEAVICGPCEQAAS